MSTCCVPSTRCCSTWPRTAAGAASRSPGLLSTRALVDLYEADPELRASILGARREDAIRLSRDGLPDAWVRAQKPLKRLPDKLTLGTTEQQFLDELNGRVFFWLDEDRLFKLLNAKPYRRRHHIVLTLRTASVVRAHHDAVRLARMNTGAVVHANHPRRGPEVFERVEQYETRRELKPGARPTSTPPVELTVRDHVPDVEQHVVSVRRWTPGDFTEQLFP